MREVDRCRADLPGAIRLWLSFLLKYPPALSGIHTGTKGVCPHSSNRFEVIPLPIMGLGLFAGSIQAKDCWTSLLTAAHMGTKSGRKALIFATLASAYIHEGIE